MNRFLTLILAFFLFVVLSIPTSAQQFEYPANLEKSFVNANMFYQQMEKNEYREYKDATYSVRRKMSYKEIPDAIMTFEKKTGRYFGQSKQELAPSIHPERQVYFFASFVQTKDKEYWKHTIIDAETKRPLEGGNSYHSYENPYR
ncbi:hypothetical protein WMO40_17300 [Bacillaceae bacterium CLA-AA-H227]|uniref:Uncharacterized protein n=1 Tax=Robertmurraya yapensis (ex Hitch et al 2024) TaxID=3133160 RepID=A0ACC6SHA5_9BACI